jgi:hypothetical protein
MRLLRSALLFAALAGAAQAQEALRQQTYVPNQPVADHLSANPIVTLPAGTKIVLALTSPVWARLAKPGDSVYSSAAFPVAIGNVIAIPPGTYVQGQIDALTRPSWLSSRATFQMHFTKMIFANGYTVEIPRLSQNFSDLAGQSGTSQQAMLPEIPAAIATVYVGVSSRSDILLDNGTQIEMVLQGPLSLDSARVMAAARQTKLAAIAPVKSATQCRPIPATPGTSDTVIPGSPGTPDTVIPGVNGMPDTVIPGIPATPATVIPGTQGTPEIACPGPPVVMSGPSKAESYKKNLTLSQATQVAGNVLAAGKYQFNWTVSGPTAEVEIVQKGKPPIHARARVIALEQKTPQDATSVRNNADGTVSLASVQFAGEIFELTFE